MLDTYTAIAFIQCYGAFFIMKPIMYFAVLIMLVYMTLSIPILFIIWFLGGNNVKDNFIKFANQTVFNHD